MSVLVNANIKGPQDPGKEAAASDWQRSHNVGCPAVNSLACDLGQKNLLRQSLGAMAAGPVYDL
jgi:hypothetical protein